MIKCIMYLLASVLFGCKAPSSNQIQTFVIKDTTTTPGAIIVGADKIEEMLPLIMGKKCALVVNQTSISHGKHLVDTLYNLEGVDVVKVFAPEHGFRGKADAGAKIKDGLDENTGLPIISLYGSKKKPSSSDLQGVDIVVFDIQDVGVRFYTYISTLHYVMQACAENGMKLIVLDRPNPNGHYVDGPMLDTAYRSFVGMHPVPVVYGMTIGEYALMINGENWINTNSPCDLTVVHLDNYSHDLPYDLPIKPSPNLPNYRSILLYPSLCFFEGTSVSIGRGTNDQFQCVGHPILDQYTYTFTPQSMEGALHPPQKDVKCYGKSFSNMDVDSLHKINMLDLSIIVELQAAFNAKHEVLIDNPSFFDKLAGTDQLRFQITNGMNAQDIRATWQEDIIRFQALRQKYLLYK